MAQTTFPVNPQLLQPLVVGTLDDLTFEFTYPQPVIIGGLVTLNFNGSLHTGLTAEAVGADVLVHTTEPIEPYGSVGLPAWMGSLRGSEGQWMAPFTLPYYDTQPNLNVIWVTSLIQTSATVLQVQFSSAPTILAIPVWPLTGIGDPVGCVLGVAPRSVLLTYPAPFGTGIVFTIPPGGASVEHNPGHIGVAPYVGRT